MTSPVNLRPRGAIHNRLWQWRRRLSGQPLTERGCGRCGYPIRGLVGTICPECGGDRNLVGVVDPVGPLPKAVAMASWMAAWALALSLLIWLTNGLLLELMPRGLSNHRDYVMQPRSGLYGPVHLRRIGYYGWGWAFGSFVPTKPDRCLIRLSPEELNGRFITELNYEMSDASASYAITRYQDGGRVQTTLPYWHGKMNEKAVLSWMKGIELDTSRADIRAEAAELLSLLTAPDFDPSHHERLRHFTVSVTGGIEKSPARHSQGILTSVWLMLWLGGSALIVRRQMRPVVTALAGPSSSIIA